MNSNRQLLQDAGLGRLISAIEAHTQPSIRLMASKRGAPAVGKLGGTPNLPKDAPWPVWQEQPLSFIAQFDLAALPRLSGLPLPRTGSVFFFYDVAHSPWGFDPKDSGCARVIYSPSSLSEHHARAPHRDLDEEGCFRKVALTAAVETSFPSFRVFQDLRPTKEEFDAYLKFSDPLVNPVYRIGGHADEIQNDIRLEAQLVSNGIYCGDGKGYAKGRKRGLDAGASDWLLLLQVDSEERTGMHFGDDGRIYFLIREQELRQRRFENIWLILQCT
jgi:uncharacterized protein YwqG